MVNLTRDHKSCQLCETTFGMTVRRSEL